MNQKNTELVTIVAPLWKGHKVVLFVLLGLLISACSRYDENSGITFQSAKKRLVDDWMLDTVITNSNLSGLTFLDYNAIDTTIDSNGNESYAFDTVNVFNGQSELITFVEGSATLIDGSFQARIMENLKDYELAFWTLSKDKKQIQLDFYAGDVIVYQRILDITRLDKSYLWFTEGDSAEWRFERHILEVDDFSF